MNPGQRDRISSRIKQGAIVRAGGTLFMGAFGFIAYLTGLLTPYNMIGISWCVGYLILITLLSFVIQKFLKSRWAYELYSILITLLETIGYSGVIYSLGGIGGLYLSPLYAVLITYLGVTAPVRFAYLATGFSGLSLSAFLLLEYYGHLPHLFTLDIPPLPPINQIGITLAVLAFLLMMAIISTTTGKRLRQTRHRLEEQNKVLEENSRKITQADQELRLVHQELEKRVETRTLELQKANERLREEIRERLEVEMALRKSEALFSSFMQNLPGLAIIKDHNLNYLYVNPRFTEHLNIQDENLLGKTGEEIWPAELRQKIMDKDAAVLADGRSRATVEELPGQKEIRTFRSVKFRIPQPEGPPWLGGIAVDITDLQKAEQKRLKLEAQMQEVQKLESLGVLAGGIAHDFNNILMSILGNADLALLGLSPASPVRTNLEEITRSSQRAAELCRQMLAYSGKGRFQVGRYNLSEIVQEMTEMLKISISKKASLRYSFAQNLPPVEADATQLRQVIMNLITNASEALGEESGLISISAGSMDCDQAYLSGGFLDDQLPEGKYVYLEVSDTGCGMDPETCRKIFDPFFTTKFTGRGLGLAAVLGIVRGHKGALKVYSEPGQGTTVKILLPASDGSSVNQEASLNKNLPSTNKSYTILLIDDDPQILKVGTLMLEKLGCSVLTASNGQEGIDLFQKREEEIDGIILDLTMPVMGGEETFRELRRLRKTVKVILSSGYNEQEVIQNFSGKGLAGFIQKPYTLSSLRAVLSQVFGC